MTVAKLIEFLQNLPQNNRVVTMGPDDTVDDIRGIELVNIKVNVNNEFYYGPHQEVFGNEESDEQAYMIY